MQISQKGIELIKHFEGCELKVYKDAVGLPTIGIGHLIKPGESFTKITMQQAEELLRKDIREFEIGVEKLVRKPITQGQFDALVSFSFNVGLGNLKSSTLLRLFNAKDYKGAADQFLRWNKAGGKVLKGLTLRREAERYLFLS